MEHNILECKGVTLNRSGRLLAPWPTYFYFFSGHDCWVWKKTCRLRNLSKGFGLCEFESFQYKGKIFQDNMTSYVLLSLDVKPSEALET